MKPIVHRIIKPHITDCRAVALAESGTWDTPWFLDSIEYLQRDKLGRRSSTRQTLFLLWRCNSTNGCDAEMIVPGRGIEKALGLPVK